MEVGRGSTSATSSSPNKITLNVPSLNIIDALRIKNLGTRENETQSAIPNMKKTNRPMPASAKRKLQQQQMGSSNTFPGAVVCNESSRDNNGLKPTSTATTRNDSKSNQGALNGSSSKRVAVASTSTTAFKKPMPASVRKRLEDEHRATPTQADLRRTLDDKNREKYQDNASPELFAKVRVKLPRLKTPIQTTEFNNAKAPSNQLKSDGGVGPDCQENTNDTSADLNDSRESESIVGRRTGRKSGVSEFVSLEDPKHICETCGFECSSSTSKKKHILRVHYGIRGEKKPSVKNASNKVKFRTCPVCSVQRWFPNNKMFRNHVRKCKNPKKSCALCDKKFDSEKDLIDHIKIHATPEKDGENDAPVEIYPQSIFDSNDIIIPASPISFPPEDDDQGELSQSPNAKSTISKSTFKQKLAQAFTNFASRRGKVLAKHPVTSIQKNKTEKQSGQPNNIAIPGPATSFVDKLTCRVCGKRYTLRSNRVRHERRAHNYHGVISSKNMMDTSLGAPPPIGSGESELGTKKSMTHSSDVTSKTEEDIRKLQLQQKYSKTCSICHKHFKTRWVRARHEQKTHKLGPVLTTPKPQGSTEKEKEVTKKPELPHPKVNPLQCKVCLKVFSCISNRSKHERVIHSFKRENTALTSQNDNSCRFCNKKFNQMWKARRHERVVHIRKVGNTLNISGKQPSRKPQIREICTSCRFCGKVFTRSYSRKLHEKRFHSNNKNESTPLESPATLEVSSVPHEVSTKGRIPTPFECEVCFRAFTFADNRRRHEKVVHGIIKPRQGYYCGGKRSKKQFDKAATDITNGGNGSTKESYALKLTESTDSNATVIPKQVDAIAKARELVSVRSNTADGGTCPICHSVLKNKLKRHILFLHKDLIEQGNLVRTETEESITNEDPRVSEAKKLIQTISWRLGGRCPICNAFKNRLKSHFYTQHYSVARSAITSVQPTTYKTFKSATDKLKQKLVSNRDCTTTNTSLKPVKLVQECQDESLCPCRQKLSTLTVEYEDFKAFRQPKRRAYMACKICWNMFSHHEDFLLHMLFRHGDSDKISLPPPSPAKVSPSKCLTTLSTDNVPQEMSNDSASTLDKKTEPVQSKNLRQSRHRDDPFQSQPSLVGVESQNISNEIQPIQSRDISTVCSVSISKKERDLADQMLKPELCKARKSKKTRNRTKVLAPVAEPEPMNTHSGFENYCDVTLPYYEDTENIYEEEESEIAITSTFTKVEPIDANPERLIETVELSQMQCACCNEIFSSLEAFQKHESCLHRERSRENEEPTLPTAPCENTVPPDQIVTAQSSSSNCNISSKKPTPASVRLKLEKQKRGKCLNESSETDVNIKIDESVQKATMEKLIPPSVKSLNRPMPASVRSKLMLQDSNLKENQNTSSPTFKSATDLKESSRQIPGPMPASMKARFENKTELRKVAPDPDSEKSSEIISISDDEDDLFVRIAQHPVPNLPSSEVPGNEDHDVVLVAEDGSIKCSVRVRDGNRNSQTLNNDVIVVSDDDEHEAVESNEIMRSSEAQKRMAEHDRAVKIVMGELTPNEMNVRVSLQCKLCSKTFDSLDRIRCHIYIAHKEYGPEHTGNLIEQIYSEQEEPQTVAKEDLPSPRKRKRNARYTNEEYVLEGTSTGRAFQEPVKEKLPAAVVEGPVQSNGKPPQEKRPPVPNSSAQLPFACKFCGKEKDSDANVRRHIAVAHKVEYEKGEDGVVELVPQKEPVLTTKDLKTPAPLRNAIEFRCRICHRRLVKFYSMREHVRRSHPEASTDSKYNLDNIEPIFESDDDRKQQNSTTSDDAAASYSCTFCDYLTTEEQDYVIHYKNHTGVSPYQCQYCAGTFNKHELLSTHLEREHTGAEFLNEDEEEFSMEEVTGVNQIHFSATVPIQIEPTKILSLNLGGNCRED